MYKTYLLLTIGFTISTLGISQGCPTNLFFSEYVEGSSNNKVLEIYNPLPYTVDLNDYVIERYTNGSTTVSASFFLGGSIASGQTYVICNGLSSPAILAIKDTVSGVLNFNGDDAMVLKHEFTFDTLDIIGKVGNDPGSFWPVAGGTTENHTLVRNINIGIGTTDWVIGATQWTDFPLDYFDSLGTHYCSAPSNSYTFENYTICSNDSLFIQMSHYESIAGIYYDTLTSFTGCDSVIVTELFTNPAYLISKDTSACPGTSLFLGGANQTVPGLYYNNYTTMLGCDSIIEFNFTNYVEEFVQLTEVICTGDSLFLEGAWQTVEAIYTDTFTSVVTGCDSIVETSLLVEVMDMNINVSGFDLSVALGPNGFQWLDCSNAYAEIVGETSANYTATSNGMYAVELTGTACVDTTICAEIAGIGFEEFSDVNFQLYPNPAHTHITLDLGTTKTTIVELFGIDGKLIRTINVNEKQLVELNLSDVENGIYIVIVSSEYEKSVLRFVKD